MEALKNSTASITLLKSIWCHMELLQDSLALFVYWLLMLRPFIDVCDPMEGTFFLSAAASAGNPVQFVCFRVYVYNPKNKKFRKIMPSGNGRQ